MKIVSLRSVGLGDMFEGVDGKIYYKPIVYELNESVTKLGYYHSDKDPKVIEITNYDYTNNFNYPSQSVYIVRLSNGHKIVLPLDSYIAEWAESQ